MWVSNASCASGAIPTMSPPRAFTVGLAPQAHEAFDCHVPVADLGDGTTIVNAVPPQVLAYHLCLLRGYDPDKPRNLAKSVTVK